jgi:hypothetical protein
VSPAERHHRFVAGDRWTFRRAISTPRLPAWEALLTTAGDEPGRSMEESFDFNLERVLDGIEMYVQRVTR